jgi:hypothetical protein
MNRNDAVRARLLLLESDEQEYPQETNEFIRTMDEACEKLGALAAEKVPADCDVGRFIAALDHLVTLRHMFWNAAKIGSVIETRKRRRVASNRAAVAEITATQPMTPPPEMSDEENDIENEE